MSGRAPGMPSDGRAPCPSARLLLAMTVIALAMAAVVVPGKLALDPDTVPWSQIGTEAEWGVRGVAAPREARTGDGTVSGRLSPRNLAITDQILATLADEGGLPISTPDLWRKISPYRPRSERLAAIAAGELVPGEVSYGDTWRVLARLTRRGEVDQITVAEMRACYWRRWPGSRPGAGLTELEAGQ